MKPASIYRNRGRMIRTRSGKWMLTFTVESQSGVTSAHVKRSSTGYQQLRGERDDLVDHAVTLGMTTLYLPGVVGEIPIEYAKAKLDEIESGEEEPWDALPF